MARFIRLSSGLLILVIFIAVAGFSPEVKAWLAAGVQPVAAASHPVDSDSSAAQPAAQASGSRPHVLRQNRGHRITTTPDWTWVVVLPLGLLFLLLSVTPMLAEAAEPGMRFDLFDQSQPTSPDEERNLH